VKFPTKHTQQFLISDGSLGQDSTKLLARIGGVLLPGTVYVEDDAQSVLTAC